MWAYVLVLIWCFSWPEQTDRQTRTHACMHTHKQTNKQPNKHTHTHHQHHNNTIATVAITIAGRTKNQHLKKWVFGDLKYFVSSCTCWAFLEGRLASSSATLSASGDADEPGSHLQRWLRGLVLRVRRGVSDGGGSAGQCGAWRRAHKG